MRVARRGGDHRFRSVTPLPIACAPDRLDVVVVVARNPGLRLQVLDAATRVVVPVVAVDPGTTDREGEALVVWMRPDTEVLRVSADGYVSQRVRVAPPSAGVADHPEPILMERGCALGGIVRGRTGEPLADAVVFVELLGRAAEGVAWPIATGTTDGEGRHQLGPLLPGRHRLRAFATGHAPARERLDLAAEDLGHDLALVARAPGATPPEPEFAWADRRDLPVPLDVADVSIGELIEWLEEVAGARTARSDAVRERLASAHVNIAVTGLPLRVAFQIVAEFAGLTFDAESGTWALPGRRDGGGGDGG